MAGRYEPTEEERRAIAEMAELRRTPKGTAPISASFRDRMASATVDTGASTKAATPEPDDHHQTIIFRP